MLKRILASGLVALTLGGCGISPSDPDGPGNPGPPVPLKQIMLNDIHGLWGGERVWINSERTVIVQVVDRARKEKRRERKLAADQWAEIERLVGKYDFLSLKEGALRTGVPDEAGHSIRLITKDGRKAGAFKWERDVRPRFDPLASYLFGICRMQEGRKVIYEGEYRHDCIPDGFENPW